MLSTSCLGLAAAIANLRRFDDLPAEPVDIIRALLMLTKDQCFEREIPKGPKLLVDRTGQVFGKWFRVLGRSRGNGEWVEILEIHPTRLL